MIKCQPHTHIKYFTVYFNDFKVQNSLPLELFVRLLINTYESPYAPCHKEIKSIPVVTQTGSTQNNNKSFIIKWMFLIVIKLD